MRFAHYAGRRHPNNSARLGGPNIGPHRAQGHQGRTQGTPKFPLYDKGLGTKGHGGRPSGLRATNGNWPKDCSAARASGAPYSAVLSYATSQLSVRALVKTESRCQTDTWKTFTDTTLREGRLVASSTFENNFFADATQFGRSARIITEHATRMSKPDTQI